MFENISELDTYEGFSWGGRSQERTDLLDAIYLGIAQWVCDSQAAAPGDHGSERFGQLPCEECEYLVWQLLEGPLGELLSYFGHAAYHAGRDGIRSPVVTVSAAKTRPSAYSAL